MKHLPRIRIAEITYHEALSISELYELPILLVFEQLFTKYTGVTKFGIILAYYEYVRMGTTTIYLLEDLHSLNQSIN